MDTNNTKDAQYNKSLLEHLPFLQDNKFDPAIQTLKKELNNKLQNSIAAIEDLVNNDFDDFDESSMFYGLKQWHQGFDYHAAREEYTAIAEMQIVYAYKLIEIGIKVLIRGSYNERGKGLFKWDNIVSFLKAKGIEIKSIEGNREINELRLVNNNIKHSEEIQDDVKKIPEFTAFSKFNFVQLIRFYERVKPFSNSFLTDLARHISKERFSFSPEKMEAIAKDFYGRMNRSTMESFINYLKDYYDRQEKNK